MQVMVIWRSSTIKEPKCVKTPDGGSSWLIGPILVGSSNSSIPALILVRSTGRQAPRWNEKCKRFIYICICKTKRKENKNRQGNPSGYNAGWVSVPGKEWVRKSLTPKCNSEEVSSSLIEWLPYIPGSSCWILFLPSCLVICWPYLGSDAKIGAEGTRLWKLTACLTVGRSVLEEWA